MVHLLNHKGRQTPVRHTHIDIVRQITRREDRGRQLEERETGGAQSGTPQVSSSSSAFQHGEHSLRVKEEQRVLSPQRDRCDQLGPQSVQIRIQVRVFRADSMRLSDEMN